MKIFSFALVTAALASGIAGLSFTNQAAQTEVSGARSLVARNDGAPSVDEMRAWLKSNTKIGTKPTIFYTGDAKAIDATGAAKTLNGEWWGSLITHERQLDWIGECKTGPDQDKVIPRIAEAIALETKNAYVVMKGSKLGKIWTENELPALKKNNVPIQKLSPGGKPVPYGDGSAPPA